MKRAILIAAVEPAIGGVLVFGDRGTGKSTAVRALASLLIVGKDDCIIIKGWASGCPGVFLCH